MKESVIILTITILLVYSVFFSHLFCPCSNPGFLWPQIHSLLYLLIYQQLNIYIGVCVYVCVFIHIKRVTQSAYCDLYA